MSQKMKTPPFALKKITSLLLFSLVLLLLISSCSTQKKLTYLQGIDAPGQQSFYPYSRPEYRLQKQDILYVNIVTQNEEINTLLGGGMGGSQQMTQMQSGGGYLMGYTIRDSGYISLPLLGNMVVLEKTMEEVTKLIEERSAALLKDARVTVKLLSYNITILGEVNGPGKFSLYGSQLTVLDALAMAGDLTVLADRARILVVRPTKEGSKSFRINLKSKDILLSEAYFLLPNDIVIVEPRRAKFVKLNASDLSLFYSTVISTFSMIFLIMNLNK
jgi:polysaccharide export outer membrane protein